MGFYYSLELRQKALKALSKNHTQSEVARMFNIDRTTIYRWIKREKESSLAPIINHNKKPHKLDREKLKEYLDENNKAKNYNKTLKEIACHFNVSYNAIWNALNKLGYVIKKN